MGLLNESAPERQRVSATAAETLDRVVPHRRPLQHTPRHSGGIQYERI